jgi:large subunit ribosomal protein L32
MLPFHKTSKSRKGTRRAHHAVKAVEVVRCPKCGQSKQPHRLCANCGHVNKSLSLVVSEVQE